MTGSTGMSSAQSVVGETYCFQQFQFGTRQAVNSSVLLVSRQLVQILNLNVKTYTPPPNKTE